MSGPRVGSHLQALHNAGHNFVLQATVLSLCVFPDGDKIDVVVARLVARDAETRPHIGIQLQLFPECKIERAVAFANGSSHGALEPDSMLLQK